MTSVQIIANPAVTIGRVFSDTFAGIAPSSALGFIAVQTLGTLLGRGLVAVLYPNDRVFRDAIAKPLKDIKRSDLRVHDLRHFAGTQVARVGNLAESMARLGHSTVKASLLYQQVVSGRDAEIAAALSELAARG